MFGADEVNLGERRSWGGLHGPSWTVGGAMDVDPDRETGWTMTNTYPDDQIILDPVRPRVGRGVRSFDTFALRIYGSLYSPILQPTLQEQKGGISRRQAPVTHCSIIRIDDLEIYRLSRTGRQKR